MMRAGRARYWVTVGDPQVTELTVWRFEGARTAEDEALPRLERLVAAGDVTVDDAALVSWPSTCRKPSTRGLGSLDGAGALWGGTWGVLLGLIFVVPIAGPALGAAAGAIGGSLADFGIDDDFIKRVRETVTPGTSAIFLLVDGTRAEEVVADLGGVAVVRCELSGAQERRLLATLGEESADVRTR
jgi:uncharacterized membrane protein